MTARSGAPQNFIDATIPNEGFGPIWTNGRTDLGVLRVRQKNADA